MRTKAPRSKNKTKASKLASHREQIDLIDQRILHWLNRRAQVVQKIKKIKDSQSIPIRDPQREKAILNQLLQKNCGPLSAKEIRFLFEAIFKTFRKRQEPSSSIK